MVYRKQHVQGMESDGFSHLVPGRASYARVLLNKSKAYVTQDWQ